MNDPKRLREGGGPGELQKLLIAAEADVLDDAAKERVRSRVNAAIGVGVVGSLDRTATMTTTSKSIVIALAAAAIGVGAYAYLRAAPRPSVAPPATTIVPSAPSTNAPVAPIDSLPAIAASDTNAAPPEGSDAGPSMPKSSVKALPAAPPTPREGLLLLQARQALNHDRARALALIRQHEREFPTSQLAPERAKLLAAALAHKGE